MKIKKIVLILMCLMLLNPMAMVSAEEEDNFHSDITESIDNAVKEWIENNEVVGATVAVVEKGETVLLEGYGYADKAAEIEVSPYDTAFRIGSISKTFVALSAMQLCESGKLNMDTDISEYLDEDLEIEYPVTMHDLLTHTAGFEEQGQGLFAENAGDIIPLSQVMKEYLPEQIYLPGEVYAYSNAGVTLAGYVIESIVGNDYFTYAQEEMFDSLSMNDTTFKPDEIKAKTVSLGYKDGNENEEGLANFYPCGSITSTANDMVKYMNFLLDEDNESILSKSYKEEMFETQFCMDESFPGIGYTWFRYNWNGHIVYLHNGGTDNFSSLVILCPDYDYGVFISTNTVTSYSNIMQTIFKGLYGESSEETVYDEEAIITDKSIDLSGSWVSTRRTELSEEKFYNIISTIKINYTKENGFEFYGTPINKIGDNLFYHPRLAVFNYVEKNGRCFINNEEGSSFIKVPWYESTLWQLIVIGSFFAAMVAGGILSLIFIIISIKKQNLFESLLSLFALALVFASLAQFYGIYTAIFSNIPNAQITAFLDYMTSTATFIFLFGGVHAVAAVMLFAHKKRIFRKIVHGLITISWIIYVIWLVQVNLLF